MGYLKAIGGPSIGMLGARKWPKTEFRRRSGFQPICRAIVRQVRTTPPVMSESCCSAVQFFQKRHPMVQLYVVFCCEQRSVFPCREATGDSFPPQSCQMPRPRTSTSKAVTIPSFSEHKMCCEAESFASTQVVVVDPVIQNYPLPCYARCC